MSDINGEGAGFSIIIVSAVSSLTFSLLLLVFLLYIYILHLLPLFHSPWISSWVSFSLCSLCFSVFRDVIVISSGSKISPRPCPVYQQIHQKHSSFLLVSLSWAFLFGSFLRFPYLHFCCSPVLVCLVTSNSLQPHGLYSLPGSSVHGTSQARILEWVSFSRGSSWPRDQTHLSCIAGRFLTTESPGKPSSVFTCCLSYLSELLAYKS